MGLSASAFVWAGAVGGKGAVPFGALQEGEWFRFPSSSFVCIKARNGWYSDVVSGKKYRTNKKVAVIRINKGE